MYCIYVGLESVSRAPIFAQFSETLAGVTTPCCLYQHNLVVLPV
jgi:hypothetical protein